MTTTPIEIIAAEGMTDLAQRVYARLDQNTFGYSEVEPKVFANRETKPRILETVRRKEVYLFHPMQYPDPSVNLVKVGLTIDALTRASVDSIALVLPYLSYSRQDRIDKPGEPLSAKFTAKILQSSPRVNHLLTMDLHVEQIEGFYDIPVDNLYGALVFAEHFCQLYGAHSEDVVVSSFDSTVVYSPDFGGAVRARRFAKMLGPDVRTFPIEKRHTASDGKEILHFLGDPQGKIVLMYDDIIDSGDSILIAAREAMKRGAQKVYCVATHGIFSAKDGISAEDKFRQAGINVLITESIPRSADYRRENESWLTILPLDDLLSRVIVESSTIGGSVNRILGRRI